MSNIANIFCSNDENVKSSEQSEFTYLEET